MISWRVLEARALRRSPARRRRAGLGCRTKCRRRGGPLGHRRYNGRVDAFPSSSPPAVQPQIVALAQTLIRLLLRPRACTGDGLGDVTLARRRLPRRALRIQVFDVWRSQHGSDAAARNAQSHRGGLGARRCGGRMMTMLYGVSVHPGQRVTLARPLVATRGCPNSHTTCSAKLRGSAACGVSGQ